MHLNPKNDAKGGEKMKKLMLLLAAGSLAISLAGCATHSGGMMSEDKGMMTKDDGMMSKDKGMMTDDKDGMTKVKCPACGYEFEVQSPRP